MYKPFEKVTHDTVPVRLDLWDNHMTLPVGLDL